MPRWSRQDRVRMYSGVVMKAGMKILISGEPAIVSCAGQFPAMPK
jgi:hypothetical protein